MKILEKTPDLIPKLQSFETFAGIDAEPLKWMIDHCEYKLYKKGELLFQNGAKVDHMQIIVEGRYAAHLVRNSETKEIGTWETGYITGVLPFSRMVETRANGPALVDCYVLELHRQYFTEMVNVSYELTQALVNFMVTRVRDFTQLRFQDEKLMALGKLSAGLAHELNNPASAMVRSSEELYKKIHYTPRKFKSVITLRVTPEQTDQVNDVLYSRLKNVQGVDLSLMEREEKLDDLLDWLEDREVEDADELAETFVDFGVTIEDLERVARILNGQPAGPVIQWIESTLSLEKLVAEIRESADRISKLVQSVKIYSHMDKGMSMQLTNIHDGIRSTMMMLNHKFKKNNIQVVKKFCQDLPKFKAYVGELNQVWTNLIINAIDAMENGGMLTVETFVDREFVCVNITDTGPGIPEEIQTRIFEPFFTTKGMGEGTGMGLDIVKKIMNRHKADIKVESVPGKTTFNLCFPTNL